MFGEMNNNEIALPLHYQQIIQAINIEPYLNHVENIFKIPLGYVIILKKKINFIYVDISNQLSCDYR